MLYENILNKLESVKDRWIILSLVVVQSIIFIPFGMYRLIDGDEGFYIYASKFRAPDLA